MPNVYANIHLHSADQGGRETPIPAVDFGCPLFFVDEPALEEHGYDCRFSLRQAGKGIAPGETLERVPVRFLSPDDVLPHLRVGTRFTMWEGKEIGGGEIVAIE